MNILNGLLEWGKLSVKNRNKIALKNRQYIINNFSNKGLHFSGCIYPGGLYFLILQHNAYKKSYILISFEFL